MRGFGILGLLIALGGIGYGWFALGWDGGTDRVVGDWIVIGVWALLAAGSVALIARQEWGWAVCGLALVGVFGLYVWAQFGG